MRLTAPLPTTKLRTQARSQEDDIVGLAATASEIIATKREPDFTSAVNRLRALTEHDLESVNVEILSRMQSPVSMIPDLAGHLVKAGGKRLRPMLTLASARLFGYSETDHIKLAAAVELIHGATLLHDDVVDDSALRRGASTANIIWGNKESVLVGDFIFSRAFELMVEAKDLRVLKVLSHASSVIAEGEVLQLTTQKNIAATFETYLNVVHAKTAALFAAASEVGVLIAKRSASEEAAMHRFGDNFGVAYQLIDDALDYAGFENALGKTVGDDFREGKMTAPVVFAIASARDDEKSFWRRVIGEGHQEAGDFERACELMARDGIIEKTTECANEYTRKALEALEEAPSNQFSNALSDLVITATTRGA